MLLEVKSQHSHPEKSNAIKWYAENYFFHYEWMNMIEPWAHIAFYSGPGLGEFSNF